MFHNMPAPVPLFTLSGTRCKGCHPRPGCFRPVRLFDTRHHRGLSLNTRPPSGGTLEPGTLPPTLPGGAGWWCFPAGAISEPPPPFGGSGSGGKPPGSTCTTTRHPCPGRGVRYYPAQRWQSVARCFRWWCAYRLPFRTSRPGHRVAGRGCFPPGHRCRVRSGVMSRFVLPRGLQSGTCPPGYRVPIPGKSPGGRWVSGGKAPTGHPPAPPGGHHHHTNPGFCLFSVV